MSHPVWVCGLKHLRVPLFLLRLVTPCMGVWIETPLRDQRVKPFLGHTLYGCVD